MGRGSSGAGGGIRSVVVDYGGSAGQVEYRKGPGGRLFNMTNNTELATKTKLADLAKRARENGYNVETFNAKQTAERDEARREESRRKPDYELGYGVPGGNREYRRTARRNRINSRAAKRK